MPKRVVSTNIINKKIISCGDWAIMEGRTVINKSLFYYILTPDGERVYVYIDGPANTMMSEECNIQAKQALVDRNVPESIKDFIRTVVILNEW